MAPTKEPSWSRAVGAIVVRPRLWATALRVLARSSPRGWWRRPPFVPRPPDAFVAFRLETQYGGPAGTGEPGPGPARTPPVADDVVAYLAWCRSVDAARGSGRGARVPR